MTIYSAVLIQYQRVTDRQTDVQPISITCFSIANARKNDVSGEWKFPPLPLHSHALLWC